mmetsp:Transcript_3835/g.8594  ORF Transcript_3835/g.8594 Transcript_3835/m.8594 type:complete len:229 (-) Transcript_3835:383-1069(-)
MTNQCCAGPRAAALGCPVRCPPRDQPTGVSQVPEALRQQPTQSPRWQPLLAEQGCVRSGGDVRIVGEALGRRPTGPALALRSLLRGAGRCRAGLSVVRAFRMVLIWVDVAVRRTMDQWARVRGLLMAGALWSRWPVTCPWRCLDRQASRLPRRIRPRLRTTRPVATRGEGPPESCALLHDHKTTAAAVSRGDQLLWCRHWGTKSGREVNRCAAEPRIAQAVSLLVLPR